VAPSSTPVGTKNYQVTGEAKAKSCVRSILFFPIALDGSLKTTLDRAKENAQADALIDIVVDQEVLFTFLYNHFCTEVHAKGIKFEGQKKPFLEPGPAVPAVPKVPPAPAVTPKKKPEKKPEKKLSKKEKRALERKKRAEEKKRRLEEKKKKAKEAKAKALEEKRKKQEEAKQKAEEKKRKAEEEKRKAAEAKRKAEKEKRKAEEERKIAAAKQKAAEESKPIPDQYKIFCGHKKGDNIRIETKGKVIEAEFDRCLYFGIRVKQNGKDAGVVPFEQIWMVRKKEPEKAPNNIKPAVPAKP
jgi:hypothetical protein